MRITPDDCLAFGFSHAAYLDPKALELLPEVRDMCAVNRCGMYGKTWACPPACGTLEALREKLHGYDYGLLLQVTGQMEDDYDVDTIEATERACKAALERLTEVWRPRCGRLLALSAGGCTRCAQCTYPDAPCRFPDLLAPSLEACGLLVSRECERAGLPYYYGPQTMTFTAAILADEAP